MEPAKHKSESVSDRADARALRSRARIDAAFVEILHGRSYASIRVSDIAKKAKIGRATFYAHFDSKDALLRSQFSRRVEPMILLRAADPCPFDCTALFEHILSARRIYRSLAGARVVRECFEVRLLALLNESPLRFAIPAPALAFLLASSLTSFLEWRVAHESDDTAGRMQASWSALVGGGLGAIRTS
jgi:AcrR family transcriptional regulator